MRVLTIVVVLVFAGLQPGFVVADESPPAGADQVALTDLLETVGRKSGRQFLQNANVRPDIVIGPLRTRDVTLEMLHTILRNNGLAAIADGDIVSIVPMALVRQYPLRTIEADDDAIPTDEWVTRTLRPERAYASKLVAVLRPMVPQAGHMVAHQESNLLTIVAPYGVTAHLAHLVAEIDAATPAPQE